MKISSDKMGRSCGYSPAPVNDVVKPKPTPRSPEADNRELELLRSAVACLGGVSALRDIVPALADEIDTHIFHEEERAATMDKERYAVVKDSVSSPYPFKFSVFHDNREEAKAEAIRLCEKEGCKFFVLKVVGVAEMKPQPVEWRDYPWPRS